MDIEYFSQYKGGDREEFDGRTGMFQVSHRMPFLTLTPCPGGVRRGGGGGGGGRVRGGGLGPRSRSSAGDVLDC